MNVLFFVLDEDCTKTRDFAMEVNLVD